MKQIILSLASLALCLGLSACGGGKSGNSLSSSDSASVTTTDFSGAYRSDSSSLVSWKGFKPGGSHNGTLSLSEAQVAMGESSILGGYVLIDLNSLQVLDLEGEMAEKLKTHLLSEDFFEVKTYPTAKFELTDLPKEGLNIADIKELKGNLTLKGKTKNITIPIKSIVYETASSSYLVESEVFRINRADWDVKYGSKSFFTGLGDKFIEDEIELSFLLRLKK